MIVAPKRNRMLEAALSYAARGWHVLPLWWIQGRECACPEDSATRAHPDGACCSAGKHPLTTHGVNDATADVDRITAIWQAHPRANIAIATGAASGVVVLDIDPRNGGNDTLDTLEDQFGRLPETTASDTGGGGRHLFFRCPVRDDGTPVPLRAKLGPGVELQRDGQYLVAVPSGHATGGTYAWHGECAPDEIEPAELPPAWVEALERADSAPTERPPCDIPVAQREARARAYVARMPTAISGEGGHSRTFAVACVAIRGFILPIDVARRILQEYNSRCRPPWSEREVEHKLTQAETRAQVEWGYLLTKRQPEDPSAPVTGEVPPRIELTDTGNAMRFAQMYRGQLVYCDDAKVWRHWDGQRWAGDGDSIALEKSKAISIQILRESVAIIDDDKRKRFVQWAMKSESASSRRSMVALAAVERGMIAHHGLFDRNPWLLNVRNGTLDLRTGHLRPHASDDWITRVAPVDYDPRATCPRFEQFVDEVFGGDRDLVDFMQRLVGYSITGDTSVHGLYVLWGAGSNGKSTLITTLLAMLGGDYALSIQPELLLAGAIRDSSAQEQLADLRGTRLAAMQETDRRKRLAEATVKMLTSNDEIVAVRKFQHPIRFVPTHKAWFATNHRPQISGTDNGIWRRVYLIPFTQSFTGDRLDPRLPETLAGELPGILAWAVRGCLEFQRRGGLEPPEAVRQATEEYRQEEDLIGRFVEECLVVRAGAMAAAGDLSKAFNEWADELGERRLRVPDLWEALTKLGCERGRAGSGNMGTRQRVWRGVGLATDASSTPRDDRDDAYAGF